MIEQAKQFISIILFYIGEIYFLDIHPLALALIIIAAVILLIALIVTLFIGKRTSKRHQFHQRTALNALNKIRTFQTNGQRERYLQKISPFVFEDLILTAYQQKKHKIKRNKKKTGDGGIDGRVVIHGQWNLIQAKRYQKSYIKFSDIELFATTCKKHNKQGVFVFVGKVSDSTIEKAKQFENLDLLYGERLALLLN